MTANKRYKIKQIFNSCATQKNFDFSSDQMQDGLYIATNLHYRPFQDCIHEWEFFLITILFAPMIMAIVRVLNFSKTCYFSSFISSTFVTIVIKSSVTKFAWKNQSNFSDVVQNEKSQIALLYAKSSTYE